MRRKWKNIPVLCLVLLMLAMSGCASSPQAETGPSNESQGGIELPEEALSPEPSVPLVTAPEEEPYVEPPTQPPVQLEMTEYVLSYDGEMADIISWEKNTEAGGLSFFVKLGETQYPLFTVLIGQAKGDFVETKKNGKGETVSVSYVMEPMPQGLSQEDEKLYGTAQELVNDINASLTLK